MPGRVRGKELPRPGQVVETVRGPAAMSRVLRLFEILAREPGLSLSQASDRLGTAKSTVLATLRGLACDGFVIADGSSYRLGPAAFRLAGTILSSSGISDLTRHYVRELSRETRESVGYAIADWEIGQAIYTEAANSSQVVHYAMRAGIRAPLYASAAGRVLLAYATPGQRESYLSRARLRPLTHQTEVTVEGINRRLDEILHKGYCASFGEMLKDTAAIAVPVSDAGGQVAGALMIAAPIERMRTNFEHLLAKVTEAGRLASGVPVAPDPAAPVAVGKAGPA